jgi:hypothetical protein
VPEPNIYLLIEQLGEHLDREIEALNRKIDALHARIESLTELTSTNFHVIRADQKKLLSQVALIVQSIEPPAPAAYLQFIWDQQGENMPVTLAPGEVRGCTIGPLNAQLGPSSAALSGSTYTPSDPTLLTVAPDPASPNTRFIATVAASLPAGLTTDAATVTANATATEADGVTTEQISGIDTVTINAATPPPPPPPLPAASIGFAWDPPASQPAVGAPKPFKRS